MRPRIGLPGRVLTVIAVAALVGLMGAAARAGIRDAIKSAKDEAARASGQKPAETPRRAGEKVQFDDATLELTGDLLDKLLECRKVANAVTKDRRALVERRDAITKEINELSGKHGGAISENYNRRAQITDCMNVELREMRQQRLQADMQPSPTRLRPRRSSSCPRP